MDVHELIGKEAERYKAFRQYHWKKCRNGGNYIIRLKGTGIGETIEVACPICKEVEDITDVDVW